MDRWINVAESPFVSWNLSVGVQVPFTQEQNHLLFCKIGIDPGEGNHVEGKIPCCVPGILPFVGHRNDIPIVEMLPIAVALNDAFRIFARPFGVAREPVFDRVMVKLFRPKQAGIALSVDVVFFIRQLVRNTTVIELFVFQDSLGKDRFKDFSKPNDRRFVDRTQSETKNGFFASVEVDVVIRAAFGSLLIRIDGVGFSMHDVAMKCIFVIGSVRVLSDVSIIVGLIFRK